ncbi:hypothetical protein CYMTET_15740 [Cymbomonas tetramitiformis]|uniref:Uncharacterized protein n=1 Tax=Cymbomonas tetramitiformis TaxID=36881 RepID=A0AAE0L8V2_9CHLO|nr:hypothetical protein CYMTET_15740 [Cymbomonas tetramitiformis]
MDQYVSTRSISSQVTTLGIYMSLTTTSTLRECDSPHVSSVAVQPSSLDTGFQDEDGGGLFEASEAESPPAPQIISTGNASLLQESVDPVNDNDDYDESEPHGHGEHASGGAYEDYSDHCDYDSGGGGVGFDISDGNSSGYY